MLGESHAQICILISLFCQQGERKQVEDGELGRIHKLHATIQEKHGAWGMPKLSQVLDRKAEI